MTRRWLVDLTASLTSLWPSLPLDAQGTPALDSYNEIER